jgi:hypothetical protein
MVSYEGDDGRESSLVTGSSGLLDDVGELLELSLGSEEGTELDWERKKTMGERTGERSRVV